MATQRSPKFRYEIISYWKENHGQALFGVTFNNLLGSDVPPVFATAGSNRVTVYQALNNGDTKLLQSYEDPDPDEIFYCCAWSYDPDNNGNTILAAAGSRGVIRIFDITTYSCTKHFIGHGNAINELKFRPQQPYILLSASKDHTLRLWNIKTDQCVAIFGGVEGHRDEVLSTDFNHTGDLILSSGMDHSIKIWKVDTDNLNKAIKDSFTFNMDDNKEPFPTECCHFPIFTTRDIHKNYVDCSLFFGKFFILSKSLNNSVVCWKPGDLNETPLRDKETKTTIIHQFDYTSCENWYIRFSMDANQNILALGNQKGKIFLWDLKVDDFMGRKPKILSHPRCVNTIRQLSISKDCINVIAVCDDGTVWRWKRIDESKMTTPGGL